MLISVLKSKHSTLSGLTIIRIYQKRRALLCGGNGKKRVSGGELGMTGKAEEVEICVKLTFKGI